MQPRTLDSQTDTIVAPATASGPAAVAIVRLSGPDAVMIARRLAPSLPTPWPPHKLVRRLLRDLQGLPLDDALVAFMPGPHSFTGEDVVELQTHGAPQVVREVTAACLEAGARPASPGEFTWRSVMHGKMDLAQAEGLAHLLTAQDSAARLAAIQLLNGSLGNEVEALLTPLVSVLAAWRAALDFPDDVAPAASWAASQASLDLACERLTALIATSRPLRQNAPTVVVMGPPNVGKSTLLNRWLGRERALVDAAPGTTRDVIEASKEAFGRRVTIVDTAGQRQVADGLEARGIALGLKAAHDADYLIWLTAPGPFFAMPPALHVPIVWATSLCDQLTPSQRQHITAKMASEGHVHWGFISPKTGEGCDALWHDVAAPKDKETATRGLMQRHLQLFCAARQALNEARASATGTGATDIALAALEETVNILGQVLGRNVADEVFERVFADFCIGK